MGLVLAIQQVGAGLQDPISSEKPLPDPMGYVTACLNPSYKVDQLVTLQTVG
jgi:hypothetical protein